MSEQSMVRRMAARLWKCTIAATAIEYALIASLISVAGITSFTKVGAASKKNSQCIARTLRGVSTGNRCR